MKHLLIILISILFLSSPVIGDNHKGETLYRWGECCDWVWKGFGDKEIQPKYQGDVENGKPNGLGIMISPVGESVEVKYKSKYPDQYPTKYIGSFKNGKKWNGKGYNTVGDYLVKYVSHTSSPQPTLYLHNKQIYVIYQVHLIHQ